MDLTEFAGRVMEAGDIVANSPDHDNLLSDIMVMDVDGELFHVKSLDFDTEENCWIISVEQ